MSRQIVYLLTLILFVSCQRNNEQQENPEQESPATDTLAIVNNPKNNLNIQMNTFTEIDSSGVLMFPLSMGETEREGKSRSYKEMPDNTCWNIIFYNTQAQAYHLLSDRKMLIESYGYKYGNGENASIAQKSNHIFYTIRTDDFNKDKKLNNQDPQYLFVSDKMGNNFKRLSPAGYHLSNWEFIKSSNRIIMTVIKDSDKNNKFDEADEITTFEIELDKENEAQEIFSEEFKNNLKILFDRDWKRLKQ